MRRTDRRWRWQERKEYIMEKEALAFTFDPTNLKAMCKLMDERGNTMCYGMNEQLEDTTISVFHEKIVYVTYQHNGWVRKNVYWRDGTHEELFDGKWS